MSQIKQVEILKITIDIGEGRKEKLTVHENDDPALIASDFSKHHNLNKKIEKSICSHILNLLEEATKHKSNNMAFQTPVAQTSKNNGEKLYFKGIQHREKTDASKQMVKIQLEKELSEKTPFHPEVNARSKKLASRALNRSSQNLRARSQPFKDVEYPFTPKLCEKSVKIAGNSSNRIQELYEEGKLKQQRMNDIYEHAKKHEFSFKPAIIRKEDYLNPQDLIERLVNSKAGFQNKIEEIKAQREVTRDPDTGQPYFKPMIGKNYKFDRTVENIWENLYKQTPKVRNKSIEFPYTPTLDSKARSDKIIQNIKKSRYAEIFQQLSPNSEGLIYYKNINLKNVDTAILKIITPLLTELQELDQPLNFEEFFDSMENLMKYLSQSERDVFMIKPKKKEDTGAKVKRSKSHCDFNKFYAEKVEQRNKSKEKLELQREKLKVLEMEECTFKPQTTKLRNY